MNLLTAKRAVARTLCHPLVGQTLARLSGDRAPNRGRWISTRSDEIRGEQKAALFFGLYEKAEIRAVQKHLRSDVDVIELGSSIGAVTAHIAAKLSRGHKLVCVEGNRALVDILRANLAQHARHLDAHVVVAAIHGGPERVVHLAGRSNIDGRIDTSATDPSATDDAHAIAAKTLRDVAAEAGIERYALVSDIEGAEMSFIAAPDALAGCVQIIAELHDTSHAGVRYKVDDAIAALEKTHGFRLVQRRGPVVVMNR